MRSIIIVLLFFCSTVASAQFPYSTGSDQLDAHLLAIDKEASLSFPAFKAELNANYDISEKKITYMKESLNMLPGEIYIALEISILSRKTINEVISLHREYKTKGWGFIARQAGIKPGSKQFHQLKAHANSKAKGASRYSKQQDNNKGKGRSKKY